jgi:hypothetical protein
MAKKSPKARSTIGAESLQLVAHIAHDLAPQVRAAGGLSTALLALYSVKLEDAERRTEDLGKSSGDDACVAYARQTYETQQLRGLVAILSTLTDTLKKADHRADRAAELTRRFIVGGAR